MIAVNRVNVITADTLAAQCLYGLASEHSVVSITRKTMVTYLWVSLYLAVYMP